MDAMKFINCEQIHVKVWFILSTMYTNDIKSVKTDQFDRSIRWLQVAMQTSIKRWCIGHQVFCLWHYHYPLQLSVTIIGRSFLQFCLYKPAYIHHVLNLYSFNINIHRFYTSSHVFDINNMSGEERFNGNELVTTFRKSL